MKTLTNKEMTFDELVNILNEENGTSFDAGDFNLSSIMKLCDNNYSYDNGVTNVEFEINEKQVENLYEAKIRIKGIDRI